MSSSNTMEGVVGGSWCGVKSEAGVTMLARAAARPSLTQLCPDLFAAAPLSPGHVVQVSGDCSGCGCSLVCLQLLSSTLLPRLWRGLVVGGCGGGAVLLDAQLSFNILQLSGLMEGALRRAVSDARHRRKEQPQVNSSHSRNMTRDTNSQQEDYNTGTTNYITKNKRSNDETENNIDNIHINNCTKKKKLEYNIKITDNINSTTSTNQEKFNDIVKDKNTDHLSTGDIECMNKDEFDCNKSNCGNNTKNILDDNTSRKLTCVVNSSVNVELKAVAHPRYQKSVDEIINSDLNNILRLNKNKLKFAIQKLVKKCLENLTYLKCSYGTQFITTLLTIDELLASKPNASLICVDTLSSFYWQERAVAAGGGWRAAEKNLDSILKRFVFLCRRSRVTLVAVKQALFTRCSDFEKHRRKQPKDEDGRGEDAREDEYNYLGKEWHNSIDYFIHITPTPTNETALPDTRQEMDSVAAKSVKTVQMCRSIYKMNIQYHGDVRTVEATYHSDGIRWRSPKQPSAHS